MILERIGLTAAGAGAARIVEDIAALASGETLVDSDQPV